MIALEGTLPQPKLMPNPREAVSTYTTLETDPWQHPTMTASGARLRSIRQVAALTFFDRFAASMQGGPRRVEAWGAFEDGAILIGAAALARVSGDTFWAQVVVAPERRRLGIGAELLDVAMRSAFEGGGRRLIGSYPAGSIEPRALVESQPLPAARRVRHGQAEVVLFISEPPTRTPGGDT
jgi:GNAT superfamily N-acetyltransferase